MADSYSILKFISQGKGHNMTSRETITTDYGKSELELDNLWIVHYRLTGEVQALELFYDEAETQKAWNEYAEGAIK